MKVVKMGVFRGDSREIVKPIWMWNGKVTEYTDGAKQIQTAQVDRMREIAEHYWLDGWIPVDGVADELIKKMEKSLRRIDGGFLNGIRVPDEPFLEKKSIPEDYLLPTDDVSDKEVIKSNVPDIEKYRQTKNSLEAIKQEEITNG